MVKMAPVEVTLEAVVVLVQGVSVGNCIRAEHRPTVLTITRLGTVKTNDNPSAGPTML